MFKLYIGKRKNSSGKVEISLRFRCGKVDQQACTNIWIVPDLMIEEEYLSIKGMRSRRYVLREPGDDASATEKSEYSAVSEHLSRMMSYIEECFCLVRRRAISRGWLVETIERFQADELPRIEEERKDLLSIIDDFVMSTSVDSLSASRDEAYALVRRSVARFEAFRRIKFPRFRLTAARLDDLTLKAFENFMAKEHLWVKKYPKIACGAGLEGRTRARGQNTVNDRMKLLKVVMRWAVRTRRIPNNPFDTFVGGQNVYGTPVYLTLEERRRIEQCDLSDRPDLALQRDIFIFQCCVGCRVSDLAGFTRGNIIDDELNYVARKTREGRPITIKVPLNRTARNIIARYSDSSRDTLFPKIYTRVGYNYVIKKILKLAGITRRVVVVNPKTREGESRRIYEVASSHMARRTFIGNIFKKFKDQSLVSELSGHAPGSRAFSRYREIDIELKREMVKAID